MFARDLPPAYEMARTSIEPFLSSNGFRLTSEVFEPESFGSAYAQYRKGDFWLRLIWDGKDGWLSLDAAHTDSVRPGMSDWKDLEYQLGGRPAAVYRLDADTLPTRLAQMQEALKQAIEA